MTAASATWPIPRRSHALRAILAGGLIAGTIDIAQAFYFFGPRVPYGIAAALLGHGHRGTGIWILGLALHYFIATSVTAIYYAASRRLDFLVEHWLVCGLVYGILVEVGMSYIVLPLSALHATGPYPLHDVLLGLGVHMVTVGVPVAFSVRKFGS